MVPEGWKKTPIGDLCEFMNGNGFKASEWSDKGLPIIRIQNLNGSKEFNYFAGKPKDSWIVLPGQLLFAWAGTRGVSFGPTIWKGPKGVLNQHIYKIHVNEGVNPDWFYRVLRRTTDLIEKHAHGFKATLVHVKKSDITDQVVLIPKLKEQMKISEIISTWDKAIETTGKLIANSKAQKKALMQQLLTGKKRVFRSSGDIRNHVFLPDKDLSEGLAFITIGEITERS